MQDLSTERALIVVKDASERAVLERELSEGPRVVETAPDSLAGLDLAERSAPDVILIDQELANEG